MHCNVCDTQNDAGSRFCRSCGTPFASNSPYLTTNAPMSGAACPACRQRNPAGAAYCVFCATPLARPAAGRPALAAPDISSFRPQTGGAMALQPSVAVNVAVGYAPPAQPVYSNHGNLLVRAVWFFFIGWWLGLIWTLVAWLFNLTVIGLPVGAMMLNAIPVVMTLRPPTGARRPGDGFGRQPYQPVVQQPFALRAIWFLLIGSWASLLWMLTAWFFCATVILMPIAFWMFDRVPTVSTLAAEQ